MRALSLAARPAPAGDTTGFTAGSHMRGIGFALLGVFLFATNNALMKFVVSSFPVSEALAFRALVSVLCVAPFLRAGDLYVLVRHRPALQALRVVISSVEIFCFFTAIVTLPLADASVLYLATPIYVTALSPLLLQEHVGWRRWGAVTAGFVGVLIALLPGVTTVSRGAVLAFTGGVLFAFVVIMTRGLRSTPNRLLTMIQLLGLLVASLVMKWVHLDGRSWVVPHWRDMPALLLIGSLSLAGYAAFNNSLRIAPASVVSPFQYASIIWACALGWAVFGDVPSMNTLAGAAIIIAAGSFIFWRERAVPDAS